MLCIKNILKEKKMTLQDLAEKLGINRVTLSNSISGNPTVGTLQKIADILEVDILDLFEDHRQKQNPIIECPHCKKPIEIDVNVK